MTCFKSIPIDQIDATELARPIDPERVDVLAAMIKARGLLQPIGIMPSGNGFKLTFGARRLAAVKLLGWAEINACVFEVNGMEQPEQIKIDGVLENLGQSDLNALERAEHLTVLIETYDALYPLSKLGGDRKSKAAQDQSAIFALRSDIAEKAGLSRRSFFLSIAICKGISPELRARIHGTDLASHQAGLKSLSEQKSALQEKILWIIEDKNNPANSVADALISANGERKIPENEKRLATVQEYMARMKKPERTAIFEAYQDDVREYAKAKGWF